jgi:hypothetical protein
MGDLISLLGSLRNFSSLYWVTVKSRGTLAVAQLEPVMIVDIFLSLRGSGADKLA